MLRRACALLALLLAGGPAARAEPAGADAAAFRQRNEDYVHAFLRSDVAYFQRALADDFIAVLADGRLIDKAGFLQQAARRPDAEDLRLRDVAVRTFADAAVVTAVVSYHRGDGSAVTTRYSCLYVRRGDAWQVEWIQWTRVTA
jgi:ketosteroid isomerase-like protein